jgi:hypothetical protein
MKKLFLILVLCLAWSGSVYANYEETLICENYEIYVYVNETNKSKSFGRINGVKYILNNLSTEGFSLVATDEIRKNKIHISMAFIHKTIRPIQMSYTQIEDLENDKFNAFNRWVNCEKK